MKKISFVFIIYFLLTQSCFCGLHELFEDIINEPKYLEFVNTELRKTYPGLIEEIVFSLCEIDHSNTSVDPQIRTHVLSNLSQIAKLCYSHLCKIVHCGYNHVLDIESMYVDHINDMFTEVCKSMVLRINKLKDQIEML